LTLKMKVLWPLMCQEILFILVGYFQDTELTIHIHLCMHQLTQSDTVLMDVTDYPFATKSYGTFQKYYTHDLCSYCHTHYMSLLCNTSDTLMNPDWDEKKFCYNRCVRDRRKSVFLSSSLMGSCTVSVGRWLPPFWKTVVSFKCWEPLAQWHIVTCQKSGILSNTAVRTSNCVCVSLVLQVMDRSDLNKMTSSNLAVVFGPTLIWAQTGQLSLSAIGPINMFTDFVLTHQDQIFIF
jgi:hypothetical protein